MSELSDLEQRVSRLEALIENLLSDGKTAHPLPKPSLKKLSIREFLNAQKPTTGNDHVVAIAYYLETHLETEEFTVESLRALFRAAKVPGPKNLNDAINQNISKGFVMEAGVESGVRKWTLTSSGEDYYANGFKQAK